MGKFVGERRRETEKEREIEREGGVRKMCQNCIPTMNMNTMCNEFLAYTLYLLSLSKNLLSITFLILS